MKSVGERPMVVFTMEGISSYVNPLINLNIKIEKQTDIVMQHEKCHIVFLPKNGDPESNQDYGSFPLTKIMGERNTLNNGIGKEINTSNRIWNSLPLRGKS